MASGKEYSMLFRLNAELGSSYSSSFNGAKGPVMGLQTEINKLNKAQGDISAYQKQQGAVEATRQKLKMLQQQYDNIQKEMTETGDSSADMKNKLIAKQNQIDRTSESLKNHSDKLNTMDAALDKAGISTKDLAGASRKLDTEIDELKTSQEQAARAADDMGASTGKAIAGAQALLVSAGIGAGIKQIYDGLKQCADAAIAFESAMAGVDKTSDLTKAELAAMGDEFQRMSTEIPVSANELAKIAETAGQLGIAEDNIVSFTTVMAKLSTATTMTAEEGATMLAQFANIVQMDPKDYERAASTIVDLGNNYATTEQKILDMSQGMAASADIVGMSEADILGLATAISSLGIESQAGSSSASKLMIELQKAVKTGKGLSDFARIAGMTGRDFSKAWGEDAAGALTLFIQGLNDTERNGKSAIEILEEMGITEVRTQRMMLSLANSGDLLNRTLATANGAWETNTALQVEAEKRYGTTESKLIMANNAFDTLKVTIGEGLTPFITTLAEGFTGVVTEIDTWLGKNPEIRDAIFTFVGILAVGGLAVVAYTGLVTLAGAAMAIMTAAIPGVGWVLGGIVALGLVGAAYVALKGQVDASAETFGNLDKKFDTSMGVIAEKQDLLNLITEYQNLSGAINGDEAAVGTYQEKQQALWDAWKSGDIPTNVYQEKLKLLRDEYTDGITETGKYQIKEDELWKAFINGDKPIDDYVTELDTIRAQHATDLTAVDNYQKKEEALWTAYTEGSMPVGTYKDKLLALRNEYGFNSGSVEDLATKQARLSELKNELRERSEGLITATNAETEAFNNEVKALETVINMELVEERAAAYEYLTKQSKLYAEAVSQEEENTKNLAAAQEKQKEVIGVLGGGYDEAVAKAAALGEAIAGVWDDESLTTYEAKQVRQNELIAEASSLMSILYGTAKDYSGNPQVLFYDLQNLEEGSTKFRQSAADANAQVAKYKGVAFAFTQTQETFLENLVSHVRDGSVALAEYETMLTEQFSGYENGAQIVADIMTYVTQATQAAANVSDMGAGMLSTAEQSVVLETAINATKAKMDELSAAYTKVYESALASINGQLKLFEEMKKPESTLTSDQMLKTLNQQAAYLDTYTANIKKATDLGVAPELVKQLSDGSIESATYLQTIVNSGNTKIGELNTAFGKVSEGKETFASTLADIQTNFTTTMTTIQTELAADITAMNLNADAAKSGKSTVQGFIDGANGMLPSVTAAYAAIAAAAAAALKVTLDIESPSKVTEEIGKYTGMGLIQGALSQEEGFRQAMGDMAQSGIDAYSDSELASAIGSGAYASNGKIYIQNPEAQTQAVRAQSASQSSVVSLSVSPVYNISGSANPDAIRKTLQQHDGELRTMVLDIVAEAELDSRRRRYDA